MGRAVECWIPLLLLFLLPTSSSSDSNAAILITFKNLLTNSEALYNWNETVNPCNWVGLHCRDDAIDKLALESMGLSGKIDIDSLVQLPKLRALSLMNNSFEGPLPPLNKLTSLRALYLSSNKLSGEIADDAFAGMNSLIQLYLANNNFTGPIPSSLLPLSKLVRLSLENNQFEGQIPDFQQNFSLFNVSNNHLNGEIPAALASINPTSFAGNDGLCGKPLSACKSSKKKTIIIIVVVTASVIALAVLVAFAYFRGSRKKTTQVKQLQVQGTKAQTKFAVMGQKEFARSPDNDHKGQLHLVRNDRERFDLQDLLRASAEVLGSGNFGSSYKALLLDGPAMVVKRFREMNNVGKQEFQEHMSRLGRLSHRNLLPLVAFYYRKDEKLLIFDFVENGSLASHLHAKRASGQPALDWPTRLKIVKGVARGLAYLHKEFPTLTLPHGHLKSSNVLLDHTFEPLLTDYGLVPVVNKPHAQQVMVAYKSPEFTRSDRTSRKTDVWSLGILILELLTGKFPANYLRQGKGANADLATWVNSVVREEWTGEVFDMDMRGTKNGEGEMLKLLKIGMCCCEWRVERRWDLREAVDKIEELKERDNDDDFSSNASEGEFCSSRAMTEDDFSFSING